MELKLESLVRGSAKNYTPLVIVCHCDFNREYNHRDLGYRRWQRDMVEYLVNVYFQGWRPFFLGLLLTGLWLLVSVAWTISVFWGVSSTFGRRGEPLYRGRLRGLILYGPIFFFTASLGLGLNYRGVIRGRVRGGVLKAIGVFSRRVQLFLVVLGFTIIFSMPSCSLVVSL